MQRTTFANKRLFLRLMLSKEAPLRCSYTHQLIHAFGDSLPPPHNLFPQYAPIIITGGYLHRRRWHARRVFLWGLL